MSHSSNHFAIAMVVLAGIMWAGSGIGAQNFFEKCSMNAMELTAFRMIAAGCILIGVTIWQGRMKKSLRLLRKKPRLWKRKPSVLPKRPRKRQSARLLRRRRSRRHRLSASKPLNRCDPAVAPDTRTMKRAVIYRPFLRMEQVCLAFPVKRRRRSLTRGHSGADRSSAATSRRT